MIHGNITIRFAARASTLSRDYYADCNEFMIKGRGKRGKRDKNGKFERAVVSRAFVAHCGRAHADAICNCEVAASVSRGVFELVRLSRCRRRRRRRRPSSERVTHE